MGAADCSEVASGFGARRPLPGVARRLSQSEKRWRQIRRQLERQGLPQIDPMMGGRFWLAVVAFFPAAWGRRRCATNASGRLRARHIYFSYRIENGTN
jgi:hypothetical protein